MKNAFLKLGREDIDYFIDNFKRQTAPVIKVAPYIRASLYRNYGATTYYWENRVKVDYASGKFDAFRDGGPSSLFSG